MWDCKFYRRDSHTKSFFLSFTQIWSFFLAFVGINVFAGNTFSSSCWLRWQSIKTRSDDSSCFRKKKKLFFVRPFGILQTTTEPISIVIRVKFIIQPLSFLKFLITFNNSFDLSEVLYNLLCTVNDLFHTKRTLAILWRLPYWNVISK